MIKPPSLRSARVAGRSLILTVNTKPGKNGTQAGTYAIPITITVAGEATLNISATLIVK